LSINQNDHVYRTTEDSATLPAPNMALTTRQNTGQAIVGIRWPDDCNSIDPATVVSDQVSDVRNLNREEHKNTKHHHENCPC
jgi:hypothetical protein